MSNIPDNPYRSPNEAETGSPLGRRRRSRLGLILAAFLWAALIFFALPILVVERQFPLLLRTELLTTFITALALFGLARSVSGWRHLLVSPLWVMLIFLQYKLWTETNIPRKSDRSNQSSQFDGEARTMKYADEAKHLWQTYVPKSGQADTVQGELIARLRSCEMKPEETGISTGITGMNFSARSSVTRSAIRACSTTWPLRRSSRIFPDWKITSIHIATRTCMTV